MVEGDADSETTSDPEDAEPPTCDYCGTEMDRVDGSWRCPLRGCPKNPDWTGPD